MDRLKILIVEDDPLVSSGLAAMIQNMDHTVAGCASNGLEAVEKTRALSPDLIIMDIKMDGMDGLEASLRILQERRTPILILTALTDSCLIEKADAIGVAGYVLKPVSQKDLEPALKLAWSRFKKIEALKFEIDALQETLKCRKLVEQAKGLLMEREGISEAEAYKRIQTMSRNRNIAMTKLAEAIIIADKLSKGSRTHPREQSDT